MPAAMEADVGLSKPPAQATWKTWTSHIAAGLMAVVFLASGIYKIVMPLDFAERATQVLIPGNLSVAMAVVLAVSETFAALMLLVPRYRRFGAVVMLGLLAAFCLYIGVNAERLAGEDCSCFPWVKRTVGPVFFVSNAVMMLLTALAGLWSPKGGRWLPQRMGFATAALGVLIVLSLGSTAWSLSRESGIVAPSSIHVGGVETPLNEGPVFLFLYDPECSHCLDSARLMSTWNFGATRVIAVPTVNPQWGQALLDASGLKAELATDPNDLKALRSLFEFVSPPYGVFLKRGRARVTVRYAEFTEALKPKLEAEGFVVPD
ncbi:MAG: hypothetical protein LC114_20320 [Bryobacterales bacterium]|nr:hypothetical protein [Bryobacterales bacterium]